MPVPPSVSTPAASIPATVLLILMRLSRPRPLAALCGDLERSVGRACEQSVSYPLSPVVHAGVLHAQHRAVLGLLEPAVEDLAREQGVVAAVELVPHGAVEPGHGPVEHGRARGPVVEGEAVEGGAGLVDLDGLHELAHDGTVLAVDQVQGEDPPLPHQLVAEGLL